MRKQLFITFIILLFSSFSMAQNKFAINGRWKIEIGNGSILEIYELADGIIHGKEINGREVFENLKFDARNRRFIGRMILPGQVFSNDVEIYYESYGRLKLIVRKPLDAKIIYLTKIIL